MGVEAVHGFIEEQDGWIGGDGAGEKGAAALASGKFADGAFPQVGQVNGFESGGGGVPTGFVVPADQAAPGS